MSNPEEIFPAEPDASAPQTETAESDAQIIAKLEEDLSRHKDNLLRALADAENSRKRALKDREDATKYAITNFARDVLDFADNFHRALAAIPPELHGDAKIGGVITGIEAMEKTLGRTLEKHGVTKMEPEGKPFDANFHEVMFEVAGSGKPPGTIVQIIETGYMLKDRLLRPARVGVAKSDGPATGGTIDTKA